MDIWAFLSDQQNREVLAWLGGGIVVIAGAAWTMIKFFATRHTLSKLEAPFHRATSRGGVAAGRDVRVSTPQGLTGWQPALLVVLVAGAILLAASFAGNRVVAGGGSAAVGGDAEGDVTDASPFVVEVWSMSRPQITHRVRNERPGCAFTRNRVAVHQTVGNSIPPADEGLECRFERRK